MNEIETQVGLPPTSNYQYAQQVGSQLFIAGQVPHDSNGNLVGFENPSTQATQCLKNLYSLIKVHGFELADIRQLKIYVIGDHQTLVKVWQTVREWFNYDVPPATLLGIASLGYENQLVEIDATIVRISEG